MMKVLGFVVACLCVAFVASIPVLAEDLEFMDLSVDPALDLSQQEDLSAATTTVTENTATVLAGHIGDDQRFAALASKTFSAGSGDGDWLDFVEVSSDFVGLFTFPVLQAGVSSISLKVNFRGPTANWQPWNFYFKTASGGFTKVGSNPMSGGDWDWVLLSLNVPTSAVVGGKVTIKMSAGNQNDVCQLDYLALQVTSASTAAPTKAPTPAPTAPKPWWTPSAGLTWQIQLQGTLDLNMNVQAYDIDMFDTPKSTIDYLHRRGVKVICYFSAGSSEDWRTDFKDFPKAVLGKDLDGWAGEKWLDVRSSALKPIMRARMDLAKSKGCDAVDTDNVDGFQNDSGFPLTFAQQIAYNKFLAAEAHSRGMAIALKNDLSQIKELVNDFDMQVNEQCYEIGECHMLQPFIDQNKPVLGIEYEKTTAQFCADTTKWHFTTLEKKWDLGTWVKTCN